DSRLAEGSHSSHQLWRAVTRTRWCMLTRTPTPEVLVAFEADAGGPEPASGLIAAGQLDIVQGTVFRYWRENLEAGERLARWVSPPEA
ncbi:hypothetical protein, partial [Kitasatospora sp. NPDC059327]|uniref:hypothetical protein n=1 Tax=Kitasatospora sp. NPDC059327 TaxID=3346803 RepID=UPI00369D960E